MKLKVCGMKYVENIQQVGALQPDYLGFIFYEKSKRNFEGIIPEVSDTIKKNRCFCKRNTSYCYFNGRGVSTCSNTITWR